MNIYKTIWVVILITLILATKVFAQNSTSTTYFTHNIKSDILGQEVTIQVSLPPSYHKSSNKFPALFILDGNWYFQEGVSAQKQYARFKITPEFIVIGINSIGPQRNWYFGETKEFLHFLENNLIPYLEKEYRCTDERLLFGWEAAGGFVFEAFTTKTDLFSAYLGASSGLIDDTFLRKFKYRYEAMDSLLTTNKKLNKFLYFTTGYLDYPATYCNENMNNLLNKKAPSDLRWSYKELKNEKHISSHLKTIYDGVKEYYAYYSFLKFSDTKEYYSLGGENYIKNYYTKRKSLYGFSDKQMNKALQKTRRNLVFNAKYQKEFKSFKMFMKKYLPDGLLDYTHYNHACVFAQYFIDNNKISEAQEVLNYYLKKFPDAARPYNTMANAFMAIKEHSKAIEYYQKAIALSKKNPDGRLEEYEENLKKVVANSNN